METAKGHHWQASLCQLKWIIFISDFWKSINSLLYMRNCYLDFIITDFKV